MRDRVACGTLAIVVLKGKAGHTRSIPMPAGVKNVLHHWLEAASLTSGRLFRRVGEYAAKAGIDKLAPHDLRSYPEGRTMPITHESFIFGAEMAHQHD